MPDYRDTLGAVMNNLGILYRDLGRPEEAVDGASAAVDIRRKLIDETPGNRHYLLRLGSRRTWAMPCPRKEKPGEAIAAYGEAAAAYEKLLRQFPSQAAWVGDLNSLYGKIAGMALEQGKPDVALETAEKAVKLLRSRPAAEQNQPAARAALTLALWSRADCSPKRAAHTCGRDRRGTAALLRTTRSGDLPPRHALGPDISSRRPGSDNSIADPRVRLVEQHEAAAVAALDKCLAAGLFKDPLQAQRLRDDAAFQALRDRDDFKKLIETVGK